METPKTDLDSSKEIFHMPQRPYTAIETLGDKLVYPLTMDQEVESLADQGMVELLLYINIPMAQMVAFLTCSAFDLYNKVVSMAQSRINQEGLRSLYMIMLSRMIYLLTCGYEKAHQSLRIENYRKTGPKDLKLGIQLLLDLIVFREQTLRLLSYLRNTAIILWPHWDLLYCVQSLVAGSRLPNHGMHQTPMCIGFLEASQVEKIDRCHQKFPHECRMASEFYANLVTCMPSLMMRAFPLVQHTRWLMHADVAVRLSLWKEIVEWFGYNASICSKVLTAEVIKQLLKLIVPDDDAPVRIEAAGQPCSDSIDLAAYHNGPAAL
ncbi:hypothetical protein VNO77_34454 [Canavalia gladiata]|uniref:Uncharacterized protein n=1 Tax=Canavalia gladiata TaxID=3824 RepID=A0AAN9PZ94_CANGL